MPETTLSEREKNILRMIVQQFILTAAPVGSRNITKKYDIGLSPATVRNIMSDLELSGLVDHPHTSAGRVPTDKGYRVYVDSLMQLKNLSEVQQKQIARELENLYKESDDIFTVTSRLLSSLTNQLACVSYPNIDNSVLETIKLVRLSSERLMVIIQVSSSHARTITLEVLADIKDSQIDAVERLLNERLSGLTMKEIRKSFHERLKDTGAVESAVLRIFYDSVDKVFKDVNYKDNIIVSGAKNLLKQPEFELSEKFESVVELIEDKNVIIHILEKTTSDSPTDVKVMIGRETQDQKLQDYSLVVKQYDIGGVSGTLGVIGPKRMEYSKIVAFLDYFSRVLPGVMELPK